MRSGPSLYARTAWQRTNKYTTQLVKCRSLFIPLPKAGMKIRPPSHCIRLATPDTTLWKPAQQPTNQQPTKIYGEFIQVWAFLPLRKTVTDIGRGPYLVGGVVDDDEDDEDAGLACLPHRRPHQLDPLEEQTAAVRRDQQQLRRVAPVAPSGGRQHRRRLAQQLNRSNTSRCRNASRKPIRQDCAESLLAFRQSQIDRDLRDGIAIWVELGTDRSVSDGTSYLRGKYFLFLTTFNLCRNIQ